MLRTTVLVDHAAVAQPGDALPRSVEPVWAHVSETEELDQVLHALAESSSAVWGTHLSASD